MAADERLVTLLGQLDISAVFDSFDHFMLLGQYGLMYAPTSLAADTEMDDFLWPIATRN